VTDGGGGTRQGGAPSSRTRKGSQRTVVWLFLLGGLMACAPEKPGMLIGDSYIVLESGQEVNLAGMPVRLIEEQKGLDSIMMELCPRRSFGDSLSDSATAAAWQARRRFLMRRVARTTRTDAQAHFRVDPLLAGRYRVWADTSYRGERWTWLAPVEIRPGDTTRVALDNANPDENPFRCKH
jgi:hypothetical protein